MAVLINYKICDNCADCSGIRVCPSKVFSWSEAEKTIKIDNTKCVKCGKCIDKCTVGAIKLAKTDEEYRKLAKEIEDDPRTISDLFVERYGAAPIADINVFDKAAMESRINSNRPVIIEINTEDTIECLLRSVPISEIQKNFNKSATYSKFIVEPEDLEKYEVDATPILRFYNKGVLLGEIVGHFTPSEKYEMIDKIREFGNML